MIDISIADIKKINQTVEKCYGYSFSGYAQSSFKRRINRVLDLHEHDGIDGLISRLESDKDYFDPFLDELTVNTTEMFRDPTFWKVMKNKIIPMFKAHQTIRIWHAGCSSGEEVFTMCIILEELELLDKVKIYASDISAPILEKAKKGIYPSRNMETNLMNYELYGGYRNDFPNYYTKKGNDVEMNSSLIRNVNWIEQNLIITKEPFMKFDIILCRNVMIYFSSMLQSQVFKLFHNSLLNNGVIGMGSKESFIWNNNINDYDQIVDEEKIYKLL